MRNTHGEDVHGIVPFNDGGGSMWLPGIFLCAPASQLFIAYMSSPLNLTRYITGLWIGVDHLRLHTKYANPKRWGRPFTE